MNDLYLIDANIIIEAGTKYFSMNRLSQYMDWLSVKIAQDIVKMPKEIYNEVQESEGSPEANKILFAWLHQKEIHKKIILHESINTHIYKRVVLPAYDKKLTTAEEDKISNDALLITHAGMEINRVVVTNEKPKPDAKRKNRKIPDICKKLNIRCINDSTFEKECGFRIPLP